MTYFEAATLLFFAIMVILCLAQTATIILWRKKIKKYRDKIAISHKKTDNYIWIFVSLVNIAVASYLLIDALDMYHNDRTTGYFYIVLMWTAFMVYNFLPVIFVRKHYVTPDVMLLQESKGDVFTKEEVQYEVNGDILKVYYDKNCNTYRITEQKDELLKMLSENYTQYEKEKK